MHSQVMKLVLICSLAAAISAAPARSPRFLFFNSLFPYNHHQQQSDFFQRFMPQVQPHPLIQQQYHHQEYQDPVDPLPYADYHVPPFHYPQPEPEPEPEPEPHQMISPYSSFQFRDQFRENVGHYNDILPPADHLEPPKSPTRGPIRIFLLFSRFPWPLEPVVQRLQNYFSTYTVPTVEPLLDEEVDLGPAIEDVDDYESQLSLAGVPTTTGKPDKVDGIRPFISSANLTQVVPVKNETDTLKVEESFTEKMDDSIVVETTTTTSTEETMMTTDGVNDLAETTTTAPILGGDAKKTMTSAMASKLLEDALFSHVLDDTDEIFMHS